MVSWSISEHAGPRSTGRSGRLPVLTSVLILSALSLLLWTGIGAVIAYAF